MNKDRQFREIGLGDYVTRKKMSVGEVLTKFYENYPLLICSSNKTK